MFFAGGECMTRHGVRRTSLAEEVEEVHTRSGAVGSLVDRNGVLRTAEANVPRGEWVQPDSDGLRSTLALLLEPAHENLIVRPQEFDNASWAKTRTTANADATTAPNGTTTADELIEDGTASATHFAKQTITKAASTLDYAFSVFVKAGTREHFEIRLQGSAFADRVQAAFNLTSGAIHTAISDNGTFTAGFADIEALSNGWYHCIVTCVSNTDTQITPFLLLHDGSSSTYNGDSSSSLYLWGAQLEQAASPSSYIPTTTVAVTRNADSFYGDFPFPPQAMAAYGKTTMLSAAANTGRLLHIGAAGVSTDPRFAVTRFSTTQFQILHDNGTASVRSTVTATPTFGQSFEYLARLHADGSLQLGISIAGGTPVEAAQSSAPSGGLGLAPRAWAGKRAYINSGGSSNLWIGAYEAVKIVRDVDISWADMRAA